MKWEFTLLDRNNVAIDIDEPVGWDVIEIDIKRDRDMHGVFFDFQDNELLFYKKPGRMIKAEYDQYGIQGNMTLIVKQACENKPTVELYRGRLLFAQYEYVCGDECYAKVPVETTSDIMELRNRWDQKVDLQATKAFDQTTDLVPYARLPFNQLLPSKGVLLQDDGENEHDIEEEVLGTDVPGSGARSYYSQFELVMDNTKASEIGNFSPNAGVRSTFISGAGSPLDNNAFLLPDQPPFGYFIGVNPLFSGPILNFPDDSPNYNDVSDVIDFKFKTKFTITALNGATLNHVYVVICRLPNGVDGSSPDHYREQSTGLWYLIEKKYSFPLVPGFTGSQTFETVVNDPAFRLNKKDTIYAFITLYTRIVAGIDANQNLFAIKFHKDECYWRMKTLSHTPATKSKVFMINEAISRVAESVTNDKIRAYSDYFGRPDAQPYTSPEDGCGALEVITKGIYIRRQENRIPDNPNLFTQSMKDIWDGINPIHNLGWGIEPDPARPGNKRMRVEPWTFFL